MVNYGRYKKTKYDKAKLALPSKERIWVTEKEIKKKFSKNKDVGYFYINRNGQFQYVNNAWLRMHGYDSADEIIGKGFEVTQVKTDFVNASEVVQKLWEGEQIQYGEFTRLNKDGSIGHHLFTVYPVKTGRMVVGIEGLLLDIPNLKISPKKRNARRRKYWVASKEIERLSIGARAKTRGKRYHKEMARLTKREIEILELAGKSYSNSEIAEKLYISVHTVLTHRRNIMAKLKIHKCTDLIIYAIKRGFNKS